MKQIKGSKSYLNYIGDCKIKKKDVCVFRNGHGKYFIKVDGITTQRNLTANEIVRWFLNTCGG